MDGQLCHLVRGKEQGRHSCSRSLAFDLSVQCPFLCLSASPKVRLTTLLCSLDSPRAVQGSPGTVPSGVTSGPGGNFTSGAAQLFSLWSLAVIFIHLNGTAHSRNVLETWSYLGISCFHFPAHGSNSLQCSFQSHLFLVQSFSDGWLPHHLLACAPRCRKGPFCKLGASYSPPGRETLLQL